MRAAELCLHFAPSSDTLHSHPGFLISQKLPEPCLGTAPNPLPAPRFNCVKSRGEVSISPFLGPSLAPRPSGLGVSLSYPEGGTGSSWRYIRTFAVSGKDHVTNPTLANSRSAPLCRWGN